MAEAAGQVALASWERSRTTPFAGSEAKQAVTVAAHQAALAVLSLDPATPKYTELTRALSVAVAFIAEMPAVFITPPSASDD